LKRLVRLFVPFIIYVSIALMLNFDLLLSSGTLLTGYTYPRSYVTWITHFANVEYTWNEYLGQGTTPFFFSPLKFCGMIGEFFSFSPGQIVLLFDISILVIAGMSAFILSQYLLRKSFKEESMLFVASFLGGFIYAFNPSIMAGDYIWLLIKYCYSLIPLTFFCFIKFYEKKSFFFAVFLALLMTQSIYDMRFLIISLYLILFYLLFDLVIRPNLTDWARKLFSLFSICVLFVLLQFHALLIEVIRRQSALFVTIPTVTDSLVGRFDIFNLMCASSSMWDVYNYIPNNFRFLEFLSLLLPIVAFMYLLFYNRKQHKTFRYALFLSLICVFTVFIPFNKTLHLLLVRSFPYGTLLRTWRPFDTVTSFSYAYLIPFSLMVIKNKFNSSIKNRGSNFSLVISLFLICLVISTVFSYSSPVLFLTKTPTEVPNAYEDVNKWLLNKTDTIDTDFKVLWVPELGWFGANSAPEWFGDDGSVQGFPEYSSEVPTYFHYYNLFTHYYSYTVSAPFNSLIQRNTTTLSAFLSYIGVKYLIIHNDVIGYEQNTEKMLSNLQMNDDFELCYHNDFICIFENLQFESKVHVPNRLVFVSGGLETANELCGLLLSKGLDPKDFAFVFLDQNICSEILNEKGIIITSNKKKSNEVFGDILFHLVADEHILVPSKFAEHYSSSHWSPGYLTDVHHGVWHTFTGQYMAHSWEHSYDLKYGFVFASSSTTTTLHVPFSIEEDANYTLMLRYFKNEKGGSFRISIEDIINKDILSTSCVSNYFSWEYIVLDNLETGEYTLTLENVAGNNAVNVLLLLSSAELNSLSDRVDDVLKNKDVLYLNAQQNLTSGSNFKFDGKKNIENVLLPKEPTAQVTEYEKISPTHFKVNVNASAPFALAFAETYDPMWVAYVNGERLESVILYSVMNGFWINQTGQLEITIEYEPQKWFYIGSAISLTTLTACIAYLIYTKNKKKSSRKNKTTKTKPDIKTLIA
jgi:hypothetical protein